MRTVELAPSRTKALFQAASFHWWSRYTLHLDCLFSLSTLVIFCYSLGLAYVAWWKRNFLMGLVTHALLNTLGTLAALAALLPDGLVT